MEVFPRAAQREGPLVGKVVGPCFVLEWLGGGSLGSIYRVQHQQLRQSALLLVFSLPATWSAEVKYRFIQLCMQEVASHLPGRPALAPIGGPGLFERVAYWVVFDLPGLIPPLLRLFQHKIVLAAAQPSSGDLMQEYGYRADLVHDANVVSCVKGASTTTTKKGRWLWYAAWMIEIVTLGGASLLGITISEVLAPTLRVMALVVIVRIVVAGLASLTGISLTKYLRQREAPFAKGTIADHS